MQNRFIRPLTVVASVALVAFAAPLIQARPASTPATAPANVEACKSCHGPQGISLSGGTPNLAGQKAPYLELQLKAFRSKDRKNDLMNAIAAQLSDSDIHDLAAYWSSLPATPAANPPGTTPAGPAIPSRMMMPANFPAGFTLYQTVSEDGTITRRYANIPAWKAAKAGQPLPDGSIILQVSYKAEKDASGQEKAGAIVSIAGMESRAGWGTAIPVLLRNGNWDYAIFAPDGKRRDQLNQAPCLACHKPAEGTSYVFTLDKLRAAAK